MYKYTKIVFRQIFRLFRDFAPSFDTLSTHVFIFMQTSILHLHNFSIFGDADSLSGLSSPPAFSLLGASIRYSVSRPYQLSVFWDVPP